MNYFVYYYKDKMPSKKLCQLLDGSIRTKDSEITQRHKDIAAAVQLIYEDVLFKMLNHVYREIKCENIVIAGGVALNSVYNGKILRDKVFLYDGLAPDVKAVRTKKRKLIVANGNVCNLCKAEHHAKMEEYDLEKDPGETKNIYSGKSELIKFIK